MNRKWILAGITLAVLTGIIVGVLLHTDGNSEPDGTISTDLYTYELQGSSLVASQGEESQVIFQCDSVLTAAIAPYRIYVLSGDILYSMDADGGNLYQVANLCYNPGNLGYCIVDEGSTELHTLWYYNGFIFFIRDENTLCCFQIGDSGYTEVCEEIVTCFTVSSAGILYGYSGSGILGDRSLVLEVYLDS